VVFLDDCEDKEDKVLGSSLVTPDHSTLWSGTLEFPDVVSHLITLQLQNQDSFGSQYGYRGTDYDYSVILRNLRESPKVGSPLMTRHSAEFRFTKRKTASADAIPYFAACSIRMPETGNYLYAPSLLSTMPYILGNTSGAKILKMVNFES
jgi:hypothetical protein